MSYFSVNILWVETFVNLLLVIILNLSLKKNRLGKLAIGLIVSQVVLMRPTLFPSLIFLLLFVCGVSVESILGFFFGLFTSFLYLIFYNNFQQFVNLAFTFNFSSYAKESTIAPSLKQIFIVATVFGYSFYNFLKSKKVFLLGATIFSLLAIFPRFGFEHLQPFILLVVLLASQSKPKTPTVEYLLIGLFLVLLTIGFNRNRYGNYFYSPQIYNQAQEISKLPGREIYLFGASDLLYPLSNKLPAEKFYIPSLPWYLNYPDFQQSLLSKLDISSAPVIVDTAFEVDGKKLINTSPQIYEYIKMNYNLVETKGAFEIYLKKP